MNTGTTSREIPAILEGIAERFPGQPVWRALAMKAKQAVEGNFSFRADSSPPPSENVTPRKACLCCGRHPAGGDHGLCDQCRGLYEPCSPRVVSDSCDCGHPPQGLQVYIYTPDKHGYVLCSMNCVRDHWRELFGFFLRRSS